MIQLHGVKKAYDQKLILDIPALSLDNGIHWIDGLNGSGKTTFLKMLAGIIPCNGDVRIDSTSMVKHPVTYRKLISFAEAEPQYPAFITGSDLVAFYKDIRKAPTEQVKKLIAFSGLEKQLSNPTGTYSSGMVKRLCLLLAFMGNVKWILLDEPLATLDKEAVHALPALIEEYRQQYGTSFIITSHQPFLSAGVQVNRDLIITGKTIRSSI
jgi:ABC-2 type transport system ATP-binding protein